MDFPDSAGLVLNKYCNEINSEDKRQRKRALENIRKYILDKNNSDIIDSYELIQKQLIRCFKDNTEAVRESSVLIVTDILKTIPAKELYISSLMPTINDRLNGDIQVENSEEVRLCLVILLKEIIIKFKSHLFSYLNDLIHIFAKTIVDPYPKVKKESCECASLLAIAIPQHFHMQSESLITPLIQTLTHQQYRIRVAGITAIGDVVRYGNNKSVNDVCGPLAERLFDQHHAVRSAVAKVVGMWLMDLPDRYSFFHKLLPLILTSLSEEITEQRREAELLWENAGKQYMLENEKDLKDKMDFLPEHLEHYPENVTRPNLGCRTLVQRELSKYLPAITIELDDWKADVRVKSAQLMCVTVQHAEDHITQHLEKTLPALYKACHDEDKRVVENIELAAAMIGYFVPPEVYWPLMRPSISEYSSSGPLQVLAAVLRSSLRCGVQPQLQSMVDVLTSDDICYNRKPEYQYQLLRTVRSLVDVMQTELAPVTQQLFTIVISVLGLSGGASELIKKYARDLLEDLAKYNKTTTQEIFKKHTPALLDSLAESVNEWSVHSNCPQRFVFEALLTNGGSAVGLNISKIINILEINLKPENEPEAILQMMIAVSFVLTQSEETFRETQDVADVIYNLSIKVLQPHLVWRAGRSAEALRTAAVSCVVAALQLITCPHSLADSLVPLLLGLVEDSAHKTRKFAMVAMLNIVKALHSTSTLTAQDISTILVVVLKRLDDNNDQVRETAVRTICELYRKPLPHDYSVECYQSCLELLYDTMLLHLDDPDQSFQQLMLDALKEIAYTHPQLLKTRIKVDNFRNKEKCEELINFLEGLKL